MRKTTYYGSYNPFRPFIIVVNSGPDSQFTVPTIGGGHDYKLDTSDGQSFVGLTGNHTIIFPSANTDYTLEISGLFPRWYQNYNDEKLKPRGILQWGDIVWKNMNSMFWGCEMLSENTFTDVPNMDDVTDMNRAFGLTKFNRNIENWNLSNVQDMAYMFYYGVYNQEISGWNVSSLINCFAFLQGNWVYNKDIDWSDPLTGSVNLVENRGMLAGTLVKSLKLQGQQLNGSLVAISGNPTGNYASGALKVLELYGTTKNVTLGGTGSLYGNCALDAIGLDNLATTVGNADPLQELHVIASKVVGYNASLWLSKGWTIVEH
jgi:hypothetical protein